MIEKVILGLFVGFVYGLINHGERDNLNGLLFPIIFIGYSFSYGFIYGIFGIVEIGAGYLLACLMKK